MIMDEKEKRISSPSKRSYYEVGEEIGKQVLLFFIFFFHLTKITFYYDYYMVKWIGNERRVINMKLGAIEAGGTKFVVAIGDENGNVLERSSFPTTTPEETVQQLIRI